MKILYFAAILLFFSSSLFSQVESEFCASDQLHQELLFKNDSYKQAFLQNEKQIQNYINNKINSNENARMTVIVPVVVHILHTGQAIGVESNISDAQIYSSIAALNEDFRKITGTNGDGNGVDVEVEFCLAERNPNGDPTNGIMRVNATGVCQSGSCYETVGLQTGSNENAVKNASPAWPNSSYYNIWVVSEINGNNGGNGIQGFAYFPGVSASLDGAVVLFNQFGTVGNLKPNHSFNRVTTHEVGHGFNLFHTFQGDNNGSSCPTNSDCNIEGDNVCDTPPHIRSNSGTCNQFNNNACDGNSSNELFVHNYMDYSNGLCMNMFSQGQKDRIQACLQGPRSALMFSDGCAPPCANVIATFTADQSVFEIGGGAPNPIVNFTNTSTGAVSYNWLVDGTSFSTATDAQFNFTTDGTYNFCLEATDASNCTEIFCLQIIVNGQGECVNPPDEWINGNFETPVNINSTSVANINNNLLGWKVSHGTPSTAATTATGSNRSMWIWSYCSGNCPNFDVVRGEGVFNCFNVVEGVEYQVCFDVATNGRPSANVELRLMRGMNVSNSSTIGGSVVPGDFPNQLIYSTEMSTIHTPTGANGIGSNPLINQTFTFVADDNYTAVWVYPHLPYSPSGGVNVPAGTNYQASMRIDNIRITPFDRNQFGVSPDVVICDGDNTELSASGGQTYEWSSISGAPISSLSCSDCSNPIASPNVTTTYQVAILDTNLCEPFLMEVTVTVDCDEVCNPDPSFTFNTNGCNIYSFNGTENGTNTNNSYSWDFGDPLSGTNNISSLQNPSHSFTSSGTYDVCLTTSCDNSNSITVCQQIQVDDDLQIVDINYTVDNSSCDASNCGIDIEFSPGSNAMPPFEINYTNLNTGESSSVNGTTVSDLCRGNYTFLVTDANCGYYEVDLELQCSECGSTNIDVVATQSNPILCFGDCKGTIDIFVTALSNGVAPYSYAVFDSTNTLIADGINYNPSNPNIQIPDLCSGEYEVVFEDVNGCLGTSLISLDEPASVAVTFTNLSNTCLNEPEFALTQGSPSGGIYVGQGITTSPLFDAAIAGVGTHTIDYIYENGPGCFDTVRQDIQVVLMDETIVNETICENEYYVFSNGDSSNSAGIYSDTFPNIGNCGLIEIIDLSISSNSIDTIIGTICTGDNYILSNGIQVNAPGTYVSSIPSFNNCDSTTVYILNPDENCITPCKFIAPTAFTPNSNGENNTFYIINNCPDPITSFELNIYNRWGENVFSSNDISLGWNGKFNTSDAPLDVYTYITKISYNTDKEEILSGWVLLMR